MRQTLATLHRVKQTMKRGAHLEYLAAEKARQDQEERVDEIRETMDRSRNGDRNANSDACWLAQEHAYRLRLEMELRRENRHLDRRTFEAEKRQTTLLDASRASRVVELVIEKLDEETALEDRRAEARRIDAMATSRWRSKKSA